MLQGRLRRIQTFQKALRTGIKSQSQRSKRRKLRNSGIGLEMREASGCEMTDEPYGCCCICWAGHVSTMCLQCVYDNINVIVFDEMMTYEGSITYEGSRIRHTTVGLSVLGTVNSSTGDTTRRSSLCVICLYFHFVIISWLKYFNLSVFF